MDIVVVGSNMVDLVTYTPRMPRVGETLEAKEFVQGHGGKGANQAVAAARLGSQVAFVSKVGTDSFAESTLTNLSHESIDTSHVSHAPGSSGVAPIFVTPQGENSILIIAGANTQLSPRDVEDADDLISHAHLVVTQVEIPWDTVAATIAVAKRHHVPVLLNPAPARSDCDLDVIAQCDFVMPNETELALLTGMPVETTDQIRAAASALHASGVTHVIVTMGGRGIMWVSDNGITHIDATAHTPVDTTGAGDACIGAFAHALTHGKDIRGALEYANTYAGISVTRRGTQTSYPRVEELPELSL